MMRGLKRRLSWKIIQDGLQSLITVVPCKVYYYKVTNLKTNMSVERILQFILDLIPELLKAEDDNSRNNTQDEEMETSQFCSVDSIITTLLEGLKPAIEAKAVAIRILACRFVGKILGQMNDDIEVLEYLIEEITVKLIERAKDTNSDVRLAALGSLVR